MRRLIPRQLQALSVRMIAIFVLLILAAMLMTGTYLWISLERFYHQQHIQSMLRFAYSLEVASRNYLYRSQEIERLNELVLDASSPQELLKYQEQINDLQFNRSIDISSLGSIITPSGTNEASDGYRVALLRKGLPFDDQSPVIKSPGTLALGEVPPSLLGEALVSGDYRTQQIINPQDPRRQVLVLAYPLKEPMSQESLGLIYIESEVVNLNADLAAVREILIMATVGALALTSLASAFLAGGITAPITQLTLRAQAMAQGDYNTLIDVRSQDEVGRLAESFNIMTQRLKLTLDEIADEKGKVEAMLNYMAEGVIAVDELGRVIHINPSARRMFALTAERPGALLSEILGALEQELGWRRALLRDEMVTCELNLNRENGVLNLRAHSAPFFTAGEEKPSGVVVVLTDISEEERLEETRRDFIANVSHELRTPLTTIKSYVETLLDGALDTPDVADRFLRTVVQETDRMSRLVSELLQMAQLDAPTRPERYLIQDLRFILLSVERKMAPQFKEKEHGFQLRLCPDAAMVLAPQDRIEQLCVNLLSNASKYTPKGGEISLSLATGPVGSEIIIQDNGIGIAAAHLPRIFERFYRVDKARSREQGGTGLGLAIVKQIIDKLGGSIQVSSEPGQGTRFTIWLPKPEQFAVRGGEHRV